MRQFRTNSLYTSWNDWLTGLYLCIQVQRSNRNHEWKGNLRHFASPGGFLALISVCTCALLILLLGPATIYPPSLFPLDRFIANLTDHLTEKCTSELVWFDFFALSQTCCCYCFFIATGVMPHIDFPYNKKITMSKLCGQNNKWKIWALGKTQSWLVTFFKPGCADLSPLPQLSLLLSVFTIWCLI